jgi:hypothetical protein
MWADLYMFLLIVSYLNPNTYDVEHPGSITRGIPEADSVPYEYLDLELLEDLVGVRHVERQLVGSIV